MMFLLTAACELGHVEKLTFNGMSREYVELQAGLLDGTCPAYVKSPIGTNSSIGKCATCGSQISCTVSDLPSESES
jgi:hypothetical protein